MLRDMYDDLCAAVPYPRELAKLMERADVWRRFCALPFSIKNQLAFADDQVGRDPGYKERSRAQKREDKRYFHWSSDIDDLIRKYGLRGLVSDTPAISNFLNFAGALDGLVFRFI